MPITRLFLDRRWLLPQPQARLVLEQGQRSNETPTIDGQTVWRAKGHTHLSWYRDAEGVYHGWHNSRITPGDHLEGGMVYRARSEDGIHWTTVDGPTTALCVLHDPDDPDPSRRYKCVYHGLAVLDADGRVEIPRDRYPELLAAAESGRHIDCGMLTAVSPDGLDWRDHRVIVTDTVTGRNYSPTTDISRNADLDNNVEHTWWKPNLPGWAGGDCFPCLLRRPDTGEYTAFFRTNLDRRTELQTGKLRRERACGWASCRDFGEWGPHQLALHAQTDWQAAMGFGKHDFYQLQAFPCGNLFLGLVTVFDWSRDRLHLELAWSPDTLNWERVAPMQPIIPPGETPGEGDCGGQYASMSPRVLDGRVQVYFGASGGLHNHESSGVSRLMLATFAPERFAGLRTGPGMELIARPAEWAAQGRQLSLNLRAAGTVRVELRDGGGRTLPGYSFEDCAGVSGDRARADVSWRGGAELPPGELTIAIAGGETTLFALVVD